MDSNGLSNFFLFGNSARRAGSARPTAPKRTLPFLILALVLFSACGEERQATTEARVVLLDSPDTILNASSALEFRVAPASARLEEIRGLKTGWSRNDRPVFDMGFVPDVIWIRTPIHNRTDLTRWYFTLRNNRLDTVDFYLVSDRGVQSRQCGDRRPLAPDAPAAYPVFRFNLDPARTGTLYVRIETDTHISFSARFYSPEEFGVERNQTLFVHVLYFALMIAMLVFQARFDSQVRGRMEVSFTLAVIFGFAYLFVFSGEANRLLWPDSLYIKNHIGYVLTVSCTGSLLIFLHDYLKLEEYLPHLARVVKFYAGFIFLFIPFLFLPLENSLRNHLSSIVILGMYGLVMVGIIASLLEGRYWVLYLLAFWLVFLLAGVAYIFMFLGYLPYHFLTMNAIVLAVPVDGLVIIVSLFARHRALKRDRDILVSRIDELIANNESPRKVPKKGPVTNVDGARVLAELTAYFVQDRPYLEEELKLTKVAQHLKIRSDQLSAVLNRELKTSFSAFVNEYRFREACRLMREEPEKNLLEIAFDCGFGSYPSFHRTFRQLAEQSPANFRRAFNEEKPHEKKGRSEERP